MKISIITPSYNSALYISETIQSVISQRGNFYIEYFIVDNCSTDKTKEIVAEFQGILADKNYPLNCKGVELIFLSENDTGMYDAVNKGFSEATGEIFAWLNADDIYLPGALATIAKVFSSYDDIHWLKGITSYITENSSIWKTGNCFLYTQDWIKAGLYGRDHYFIQQDSVFWRSWLWKKSGGISTHFKRAGDYHLWIKFAELAPLITVNSWLSCFRTVRGQISENVDAYREEVKSISPTRKTISRRIQLFSSFEKRLPGFINEAFFQIMFGRLEFSAVTISDDGEMTRIKGNYFVVSNYI